MTALLIDPSLFYATFATGVAGISAALLVRQHRRHKTARQLQLLRLTALRDLILNLQRHRGLSTGVLSGDPAMQPELRRMRQSLDHLFSSVSMSDPRYASRWGAIDDHWSRLRQTDQQTIENNLRQHHQIIRNALFLIQDVAADDRVVPHPANRHPVWHEVLEAAEWAGQARALGTGMAATETSSAAQRVRMRFLSEKIHALSRNAFNALRDAPATGIDRNHLMAAENAVSHLLQEIETELLAGVPIQIPAQTYFQDATTTVDALFQLVEDTLATMAETHEHHR